MTAFSQFTLNIRLRDDATLDNFYVANKNQELINYMPSSAYIWGKPGSGRSHLLQACCNKITAEHSVAIYLPLAEIENLSVHILENLENVALICLDDIDNIIGNNIWEEAVFHLINRVYLSKTNLLVTASAAPNNLKFNLPDLQSRLTACVIFQLHALTDEQKLAALQMRAKIRGLSLPTAVAKFLLTYCARDTASLFLILEKLDQASLALQRKLTIPFVKHVLKA